MDGKKKKNKSRKAFFIKHLWYLECVFFSWVWVMKTQDFGETGSQKELYVGDVFVKNG